MKRVKRNDKIEVIKCDDKIEKLLFAINKRYNSWIVNVYNIFVFCVYALFEIIYSWFSFFLLCTQSLYNKFFYNGIFDKTLGISLWDSYKRSFFINEKHFDASITFNREGRYFL